MRQDKSGGWLRTAVLWACLAALLAVGASPVAARAPQVRLPGNGSWSRGGAVYGEGVQRGQSITMDDGVRLSADVHYPVDRKTGLPARGPFPVLLAIEPYAKDSPVLAGGIQPTSDFVPYGYLYVVVDVRGTGASGGAFGLFGPREQRDALAVVDWAARRPRSNGKVGMVGASYPALSALMTAGNEHPGSPLKAIFPIVAPSDVYRDLAFPGGILNAAFMVPYGLGLEAALDTVAPLLGPEGVGSLATTVPAHVAGAIDSDVSVAAGLLIENGKRYDSDYWEQRRTADLTARIAANGIATFVYNAWFDIWQRGDARVYAELQNGAAGRNPDGPMPATPRVDPRLQTAIGPYVHGGLPGGGVSLRTPLTPPSTELTVGVLAREWFDTWLKDVDTGMAATTTPLHLYEVGGGRWIESTTWPLPATNVRTYWLGPGRSGSAASLNDGSLLTAPPSKAGTDRLPWLGVNSPCNRLTDQELINGPVKSITDEAHLPENPCFYDDRTLQLQGLTYTTAPFAKAMDVAGPVGVTLYASANTSETEWVVTLDDVSPDGASRPLATGDLLGSFRRVDASRSWVVDGKVIAPGHAFTAGSRSPVVPSAVTRYDIEIPGILARIAPGHRLRITVNSSYLPYLLPTASDTLALAGGVYDVRRSAQYPSSVNIPFVDPARLPTSTVDWGRCSTDC